jgi:hypothetical protein
MEPVDRIQQTHPPDDLITQVPQCGAAFGLPETRQIDRHQMGVLRQPGPGGLVAANALRPRAQQERVVVPRVTLWDRSSLLRFILRHCCPSPGNSGGDQLAAPEGVTLERRGRSGRQGRPGLLRHHVRGVPTGPVRVPLAGALLVLSVGRFRPPERLGQVAH